jgi:hypothetical protein
MTIKFCKEIHNVKMSSLYKSQYLKIHKGFLRFDLDEYEHTVLMIKMFKNVFDNAHFLLRGTV